MSKLEAEHHPCSVCLSIIKVCTQLWVLHLSSVKISESQRQRSATFSLTFSLFSLILSIFSFWSLPLRSARLSWWRGTGQALSVYVTLCYSSVCVCVCVFLTMSQCALKNTVRWWDWSRGKWLENRSKWMRGGLKWWRKESLESPEELLCVCHVR